MKRNIEVFTTILLFMLVSSILTISSAAVCSHVWDEKGHCKNGNCNAVNRTLYATKYVEDTVTYNGSRIYQFKPVVSGVYTICTTGIENSNVDIEPENSGDSVTDTYIRVYSDKSMRNLMKENDDIATNGYHQSYNPTKDSANWLNYNSSVTMYFVNSNTYYIKLTKGGSKKTTISYNIHVKSYAGSLMGYFYGNNPNSKISTTLSSEQDCIIGLRHPHEGYDIIGGNDGFPGYSPTIGIVTDVGGSNTDSRGYFVEVRYASPTGEIEYMRFLHLKSNVSNYVKLNDTVTKTKTIGFTGNTGNGNNGVYQTHLHVDIHTGTRKGGTLINPSKYYANTMIYS